MKKVFVITTFLQKRTKMQINDYQTQALSFRLPSADHMYALLNLTSEVGELNGHIAKGIRDEVPQQTIGVNIAKELGDILWCVAAVCADMGLTLEDIAQGNLDKLTKRKATGTIKGSGDSREDITNAV